MDDRIYDASPVSVPKLTLTFVQIHANHRKRLNKWCDQYIIYTDVVSESYIIYMKNDQPNLLILVIIINTDS